MGMDLSKLSCSLIGYGNVGSWTGRLLQARGTRLKAGMDHTGAIRNKAGIDAEALATYVARTGGVKDYPQAEAIDEPARMEAKPPIRNLGRGTGRQASEKSHDPLRPARPRNGRTPRLQYAHGFLRRRHRTTRQSLRDAWGVPLSGTVGNLSEQGRPALVTPHAFRAGRPDSV